MKYKLAVIGANKPLEDFYSKIDKNLFKIYGFAWAEGAICKKYCDKFFPISFTEKDEILRICREIGIDGITSFSLESAVPTVNYIAQNMGLIGNGDLVNSWVGKKDIMRKILTENKIGYSPKFKLIHSEKELEKINIPFPIIVKPDDGGGSKGVSLVNNKEELIAAYRYSTENSRSKKVIIEEYVEGPEISVEYISYKGKHHYIAITDKTTSGAPYFVELKHEQPTQLPEDIILKVKHVVEKALSILGIKNSPSHTEIKINKDGIPTIIEIGPRMGGGHITSDLVYISTGYDFVNNNCKMVCGEFNQIQESTNKKAGILYNTPFTRDEFNKASMTNNIMFREIEQDKPECRNNSERTGYIIYTK